MVNGRTTRNGRPAAGRHRVAESRQKRAAAAATA